MQRPFVRSSLAVYRAKRLVPTHDTNLPGSEIMASRIVGGHPAEPKCRTAAIRLKHSKLLCIALKTRNPKKSTTHRAHDGIPSRRIPRRDLAVSKICFDASPPMWTHHETAGGAAERTCPSSSLRRFRAKRTCCGDNGCRVKGTSRSRQVCGSSHRPPPDWAVASRSGWVCGSFANDVPRPQRACGTVHRIAVAQQARTAVTRLKPPVRRRGRPPS